MSEAGPIDAPADGGPDTVASECSVGNALLPLDGWVDATTNCAGIQGRVWFGLNPDPFAEVNIIITRQTNEICAEGFQQTQEPWSPFDVSFGLNLNEPQPDLPAPYDAEAHGVVGFEFVLTDVPLPYFGVMSDGVLYCAPTPSAGTYRVALSNLHEECWNGTSGATPNPGSITSIGFYSGVTESVAFQGCVENLIALESL